MALFVRSEFRDSQIFFQVDFCKGNLFADALHNFFGSLSAKRTDRAFQFPHAGFSGIAVNDRIQHLVRNPALGAFQTVFFQLLFQQMLLGNVEFFLTGIAAQFDNFHTIQQRCRNRIQRAVATKSTLLKSKGTSI